MTATAMNPPPSSKNWDFFRGFAFHQGFQTPSFVVGCSIRKFLTRAGTTMSNVPLKDKPRPIARALAYFFLYALPRNIIDQVAPRNRARELKPVSIIIDLTVVSLRPI